MWIDVKKRLPGTAHMCVLQFGEGGPIDLGFYHRKTKSWYRSMDGLRAQTPVHPTHWRTDIERLEELRQHRRN